MRKDELDYLVMETMKKASNAQSIGAYSAEAESLLFIWQALLKVLMHLQEEMNAPMYKRAVASAENRATSSDAARPKRQRSRKGASVAE